MAWADYDEALEMVAGFGPWQARTFLLLCLTCSLAIAWHMFSHVFIAAYPTYHCDVPIDYEQNQTLDMFIPKVCDGSECYLDECSMFSNYTGNGTSDENVTVIACVNGFYYYGPFESTIVTQWDLVCGEELRESTVYAILGGGLLAGALIFTTLSDFFGRKNVCLMAMVMLGAVGLGQAFLPNYIAYCVFQFLRGMAVQGVFLCGVVLFTEMLPPSQRVLAGVVAQGCIALGMMTLTGLAYGLKNHQHLTASISAPFLLGYFMYWLIPESIPWLVIANRLVEAEFLVKLMFKVNKVDLPEYLVESLRKANDPKEPSIEEKKDGTSDSSDEFDYRHAADISFFQACRSKRVVLYLVVLILYWFTMPLVYYGMTLSAGNLAGDIYLNFFLLSVVELPSALVCLFLLPKFGRKKTLFISHSISCACLLVILLEQFVTHDADLNILGTILTMLIKFGSGSSFLIALFYTPEIFPTPVRNIGTGITAAVGTVTNIVVPFVIQTYEIAPWLPSLIFLICMAVSGLLVIVLPETMGRPLPQTIADLESWTEGCCGDSKGTRFIYDMKEINLEGEFNDGFEPDIVDKKKTSNKSGFYEENIINGGPEASPKPSITHL